MAQYQIDPVATPTGAMPNYLFAACGQTIVNDRTKASLIPNHILVYLRDAIGLRNAEVARWKTLSEGDSEVRRVRDRHIAFIEVLEDIMRMFDLALRPATRGPPMMAVTGGATSVQNLPNDSTDCDTALAETSIDQPEIASSINPTRQDMADTAASLESASTHTLLSHIHLISQLIRDVLDLWDGIRTRRLSLSAIGFATGFAYHLIDRMSSIFEITEDIPETKLPNCPDAGLLGILYNIYVAFEQQKSDENDHQLQAKASREGAEQLFMPTVGAYLALWVDVSEEMSEFLRNSGCMPNLSLSVDVSNAADLEQQALYDWRSTTSLHVLRVFRQMGNLEATCQLPCHTMADVLTRSLPRDLWEEKVATWEALSLHLPVGVLASLNLSHNQTMPGCALIDIGHHARREISAGLSQLEPTSATHFKQAESLVASLIFKDPSEILGHKYKYQPPPNFKLQHMPALNGSISQAALGHLGAGVAAAEKAAPIMTATATLYRALFSICALEHCWHDMEYLISFYGQQAIFHQPGEPTDLQDFFERSKQVLTTGATRVFVQPSKFQELVYRYSQNCSTDAFCELLHYIETVPEPRTPSIIDNAKRQAEGIFESRWAWEMHEWETSGVIPSDNAPEDTWEELESMSSTMFEPCTPTYLRLGQSEEESPNQEANDAPRKALDGLDQLSQAHDIVTHMDIATFWLECHDIVNYIKGVYVDCTGSEPFTNSNTTYRHVWLFLEFLYRKSQHRGLIVEPVAQILHDIIK